MRLTPLAWLLAFPIFSGVCAAHGSSLFLDDPNIWIEGRYASGAQHAVKLGFPGVTLHLRANASSASISLAVTKVADFDVSVDGSEPRCVPLKDGDTVLNLFSYPAGGVHDVEIWRRTESWQGTCELRALELNESGALLPITAPKLRLMFIGDSITCGAAVLPSATGDLYDPLRSDARLSYGQVLARKLGAQCHLVSYGGRGLVRDWQGLLTINNAPEFYDRALPDDPSAPWDFHSYVPDAIGICLGTNDFNQGIPDENVFVNTYVQFVAKIRRDAPNAVIFLVDSPMLTDGASPKRSVLSAYIEEAVAHIGSPQVRHIQLPHYHGGSDNPHPTAADHLQIAKFLEPYFAKALHVNTP